MQTIKIADIYQNFHKLMVITFRIEMHYQNLINLLQMHGQVQITCIQKNFLVIFLSSLLFTSLGDCS